MAYSPLAEHASTKARCENLMRELDPDGCEQRRSRALQRRRYSSPGPNHTWHVDGYDKLKPFGFPVHGCIDGWSRRIMWLKVTKSNNHPEVAANFYLDTVSEVGGCEQIVGQKMVLWQPCSAH